jgi:ferritin-like metal-binding protein YciE
MENLKELFEETLKDVYYAEKAIIKALPKMARKTKLPELKQAFEEHTEQTKGQVERLDQIFKLLGKRSSGKECPALKGLVEETEELMSEAKSPDVMDAGLIGCAQAVEHYEIARYGTLRAWAEQLDMPEAVELLETTLEEEKMTDEKLSQLALGGVNQEAEEAEAKGTGAARKAPAKSAGKSSGASASKSKQASGGSSASRSSGSSASRSSGSSSSRNSSSGTSSKSTARKK